MAGKKSLGYVTTMVCVTCGAEQFFDDAVPSALTCPKCQATVFRQFTTPTAREASASCARSVSLSSFSRAAYIGAGAGAGAGAPSDFSAQMYR